MKSKDLIAELQKFDGDDRVAIYSEDGDEVNDDTPEFDVVYRNGRRDPITLQFNPASFDKLKDAESEIEDLKQATAQCALKLQAAYDFIRGLPDANCNADNMIKVQEMIETAKCQIEQD